MVVSDKHSGDVPAALNLKTGEIAPRWHVTLMTGADHGCGRKCDLPDFHSDKQSQMIGADTCSIPNEDKGIENFESICEPQDKRRLTEIEDDTVLSFEEFAQRCVPDPGHCVFV